MRQNAYRYVLTRKWGDDDSNLVMFIGLNPSTADEHTDDPTIRRCTQFAKAWGYDGLIMTNLFALRATDPREMIMHADPVGEMNDVILRSASECASKIVAMWGNYGGHRNRGEQILKQFSNLHYLKMTQLNQPAHVLYLPNDLTPKVMQWSC